jgi:hypothetical protein
MRGPTKSPPSARDEWRAVVRGNAPVRYEREDGAWVEVRPTREAERAVYEVRSSRGPEGRCDRYADALSAAQRVRSRWDHLAKRPPRGNA